MIKNYQTRGTTRAQAHGPGVVSYTTDCLTKNIIKFAISTANCTVVYAEHKKLEMRKEPILAQR